MKNIGFSYRIGLLQKLDKEFEDDTFIDRSKYSNSASFSRDRFFNLRTIIVFIMLLKTSYQREINSFCKKIVEQDYNIRQVTAGALTQARAKLNPWAFQRLSEVIIDSFYEDAPYNDWKGHRLLAVDGSVLNLPKSQSIIKEFGHEKNNQNDRLQSMARCSMVYDVLNFVTIDAQIGKYRLSEKELFKRSLHSLRAGDLILADRGYGFLAIMHWISGANADFCIRIKSGFRNVVKQFMSSNQSDEIIKFEYTIKVVKELGLPQNYPPKKVRLIKVELENGNVELLCTSLFDKDKYPKKEFKKLYFKRWKVEEAYKMLKARINIEAFSGKTSRSIYQDFYAKILMMNLCSTLSYPIEEKVRKEYSTFSTGNKYSQQMNRTNAIAETRENLISLILKKMHQKVIDYMDLIIEKSRTIIRIGRKFQRKKSSSKRNSPNYKQL